MRKKWLFILLTVLLLMCCVGCSGDWDGIENPEALDTPRETVDIEEPPEISVEGVKNASFGTATEIHRNGEIYDYKGWRLSGGDPGIYFLIYDNWVCVVLTRPDGIKHDSYNTVWMEIDGHESRIVHKAYITGIADITSPHEAVMDRVAILQAEGWDVEYGEYRTDTIKDGYYCKRIVKEKEWFTKTEQLDIQIFYTDGYEWLFSLSLKMAPAFTSGTLVEDNFWKMANSYYLGMEPLEYYYELTGEEHSFGE